MPDAREIYQCHAGEYDALVRCEDREGNLLPAIQRLVPLEGLDVVEFGAGTGRLTMLLAPYVRSIRAFDNAPPMAEVARRHLGRLEKHHWEIDVADNANLPVPNDTADLVIASGTYGHQTVWDEQGWRGLIARAMQEMLRVLRSGGTAIVIETLGTGHTVPFDPPKELARYYALLADEFKFTRTWIRTDYEFPSMEEGVRLVRFFFFGEERASRLAASESSVLPECTGLWSRTK